MACKRSQQLQACTDPQETAHTGSEYDDQSKCEQACSSSGRSTADEECSWHAVPFCIRNAMLLSVIPEYCGSLSHVIACLACPDCPCAYSDMNGRNAMLLRYTTAGILPSSLLTVRRALLSYLL